MSGAGPEGEMANVPNGRPPHDIRFAAITTSVGVVVSAVLTAMVTYVSVQKAQSPASVGSTATAVPGGASTTRSNANAGPCSVAQIKTKLSTFAAAYDGLIAVTSNDVAARTRNPNSPNNALTKQAVDQAISLRTAARTELDQAIEGVEQRCVAPN